MSCVYVCVALYNNTRHTTRDHLSKPLIHFQGSPAAGRRRLHLRQRNLARPPSCTRHAPSWAWWYTVHRSIDGVHREKLAAGQRRWRCCDGVATPALPFSCGLEPVCGIDMISIAHLASHLLTPGSRVADLNGRNGMSLLYCCFAVSHTRLVVHTIDHAHDAHDACDSARSPETLRD